MRPFRACSRRWCSVLRGLAALNPTNGFLGRLPGRSDGVDAIDETKAVSLKLLSQPLLRTGILTILVATLPKPEAPLEHGNVLIMRIQVVVEGRPFPWRLRGGAVPCNGRAPVPIGFRATRVARACSVTVLATFRLELLLGGALKTGMVRGERAALAGTIHGRRRGALRLLKPLRRQRRLMLRLPMPRLAQPALLALLLPPLLPRGRGVSPPVEASVAATRLHQLVLQLCGQP
mmetsp:Transcript_17504/g.52890  ORF Transcript_17504/g.52890 Transcript_17504/m.52890 type:complete len:233 (+) Transcript_17504:2142-2840(+)